MDAITPIHGLIAPATAPQTNIGTNPPGLPFFTTRTRPKKRLEPAGQKLPEIRQTGHQNLRHHIQIHPEQRR